MVPARVISNMDGESGETMQSLPDTLSSIMGFNKYLTPSWIESVSHMIKELSPTKPKMKAMVCPAQNIGHDDTESDTKVAKIQEELVSLNAQLKQITLQRRQSLNNYLDLKGNIRVFCRVRPFHHEGGYQSRTMFTLDESNVFLKVAETKIKQYKFDKVFKQCSTQGDVFAEVEPVIKSALDGYNVCIFAYGQTGSGKTYTMEGKPTDLGVIPRGIQALFDRASESNRRILFTFSMLEIYMGNLRDLLVSGSKTNSLKKVPSLIRISLTSFDAPERKKARNKLWMIDLGGSERLVKTKATGKRLKEGKAINLSLSALGDVIDALQTKKSHIPYRNSKLTQVLRDSIGCESKTLMLVHIRPNEDDLCETICTLGFATRVRSIRLENEEQQEVKARKEHLLMELEQEIGDLEQECECITRKIKKLEETVEHLKGPKPSVETNFTISIPTSEELKTGMSNNTRNSKNQRDVPSRLPRFMKPTACSQQRIGLNKHIPVSNRTKPPVPPKRRPSSVYAESVRLPVNAATWQSECSSECSISMTSDMNWIPSIQDGTECSQDTSEYETKQVIFSEHEKLPQGQVISFAESGKVQDKTKEMGTIDIDSWINEQIVENTGICHGKRMLDITEVTEYEPSYSSTVSPIQKEWTNGSKQAQDENRDQNLCSHTQNVEDIKQTTDFNQLKTTELCTPSKEFCSNDKTMEHKNRLAYHGSCRRSLQEDFAHCKPDQPDKEPKVDPNKQPEIKFHDNKHHIGKLTKLIQVLQMAWIGALLGLGTMSLGLEQDFFQSLTL
ncbi:hypothetical protein BS78_03G107800 [Paspalum vaginatum]|nr:hypothetical protein BS78_03G107800 [Paspalum vaginatum]